MLQKLGKHLDLPGELLVAALHGLLGLVDPPLHHLHIRHHQLQVDDVDIPQRIRGPFHMGHVGVLKAPHHMDDGIGGADIGQEFVAQALALGGALHQTGDVHEFHHGGGGLLGLIEVGKPAQPLVRHADHAYIGVDGAEGVIVRRHAGVGDGVEQGRFAHIGQTHDTKFHRWCISLERIL